MRRWLLLLFGCLSLNAFAQPAPEAAPAPSLEPLPSSLAPDVLKPFEAAPPEEMNFGWVLVRTLVVLGGVVALVYVSLHWGLRKVTGFATTARGSSVIEVLERVPLDQKRALFVVKVAHEVLLLGGGGDQLGLITKLDAAEVERLRSVSPPKGLSLSPLLQKLLARKGEPPTS